MVNCARALGLPFGSGLTSRDIVASIALSSATSGSTSVAVAVFRFGIDGTWAVRLRSMFGSAVRRASRTGVATFGFAAGAAAARRAASAVDAGGDALAASGLAAANASDDDVAASGIAMIVAPTTGSAAALAAEAAGGGFIAAVAGAAPTSIERSALASTGMRWLHHDQPAPQATSSMVPASNQPNLLCAETRWAERLLGSNASSMRIDSTLSVPEPLDRGELSSKLGLPEAGCAIEDVTGKYSGFEKRNALSTVSRGGRGCRHSPVNLSIGGF